MKLFKLVTVLLMTWGFVSTSFASDGANRLKEIKEYNTTEGIALKGFDPVSYFPEGGSNPVEGKSDITFDFGGVTYQFATEANLDLFVNEAVKNKQAGIKTLKYEPTYGGWCAYAMGVAGEKVDIEPNLYDLDGDRLHVFFSQGTLNDWIADRAKLEKKADRKWSRILKKARNR